jgi:predicted ArsR family transcriptional regulator
VSITIPDRRPDLLAELLLDAVVATGTGSAVETAATEAATDRGRRAGTSKRAVTRPGRLGPERALTLAESLLAEHGFEPTRETPTCVRLRNCPFHPLAARAPALVCGLNHAFVEGMLEGLGASRLKASLSPAAGHCCVRLDVADDAGR